MNIREKMMKSLEGKFSFSYGADQTVEENTDKKEQGSKEILQDVEEDNFEDPSKEEVKREVHGQEAEDTEHVEAMEKVGLNKLDEEERIEEKNLEAMRDAAKEENASLLKTITELRSQIEETKANSDSTNQDAGEQVKSLKAELISEKEKQKSLEQAIDQLQKEVKDKEDCINDVKEKWMLFKNQTIDERKAAEESNNEAVTSLRDKLEASKAKANELQEIFNSMEAEKEQMSEKLLEVTQILQQKKYDEAEKLIELQRKYDEAFEKKDLADRTLDYTRKIVEDQRAQLSTSVVKIQQQKDMVSRKEMERQKSMKEFKSDIQEKEEDLVSMEKIIVDLEAQLSMSEENRKTMEGDHEQVGILRKKIEELEQMVQKSEATEKNKEVEEQKKVEFVNSQTNEIQEKTNENGKLEEKIAELEHELQYVKTKHAEQNLEGRKKLAVITLVLDSLKNKYNLNPEHVQVISDLEIDIKNITHSNKSGEDDEKKGKKTRDIGDWRAQSFRYAKAHTKNICCSLSKNLTISQKCAIGVAFLAISLGLVLLGKRMLMG